VEAMVTWNLEKIAIDQRNYGDTCSISTTLQWNKRIRKYEEENVSYLDGKSTIDLWDKAFNLETFCRIREVEFEDHENTAD
jgi:hypothetical protein